jgi:hypothetical protein
MVLSSLHVLAAVPLYQRWDVGLDLNRREREWMGCCNNHIKLLSTCRPAAAKGIWQTPYVRIDIHVAFRLRFMWFPGNIIIKVVNEKYFLIKNKFSLVWKKKSFERKIIFKSCEKIKISCYLLIILNLIFKFLITIYFVLNIFLIVSLKIWFNLFFI